MAEGEHKMRIIGYDGNGNPLTEETIVAILNKRGQLTLKKAGEANWNNAHDLARLDDSTGNHNFQINVLRQINLPPENIEQPVEFNLGNKTIKLDVMKFDDSIEVYDTPDSQLITTQPTSTSNTRRFVWPSNLFITVLVSPDNKGEIKKRIIFSTVNSLSAKKQQLESSNLNREQVMEMLKLDFPWVEETDIFNSDGSTNLWIGNIQETVNYWSMHDIDKKRIDPLLAKAQLLYKEDAFTYFHGLYIAARNYLRKVELACKFANKDINDLKSDQRRSECLSMESTVQVITKKLLEKRKEEEKSLLGFEITTNDVLNQVRFVDGNTVGLDPSWAGLVSGDWHTSIANTKIPDIDSLVDVISHEYGHTRKLLHKDLSPEYGGGYDETSWLREEIWNEFLTVIYPKYLMGDDEYKFDAIYHYNPTTNERGGALTLLDMYKELIASRKVSEEDVKRSLLISWYLKKERGVITINNDVSNIIFPFQTHVIANKNFQVIGFADMYEEVTGNSFNDKLAGCSDTDYSNIVEKKEIIAELGKYKDEAIKKLEELVHKKVLEQMKNE